MSPTYKSQRRSSDMDRLGLDIGPQLRPQRLVRHEVDALAKQILNVELDAK